MWHLSRPLMLALLLSMTLARPVFADDWGPPKEKAVKKLLAADPPKDDGRIVPGWRAGPIHLGMTTSALLKLLGEPDQTLKYGLDYVWGGTYVQTIEGRVASISVAYNNSPSTLEVADGIGIGSTQLALVAALGEPQSRTFSAGQLYFCYSSGLIAVMRNDGRIGDLYVVTKARSKRVCNG